jgi:hypothetical protein
MMALSNNFFVWWMVLAVFRLPQTLGITSIFYILPLGDALGVGTKLLVTYRFVHRRIVPLRIPLWQTFGAPTLAAAAMGAVGWIYYHTVFMRINAAWGTIAALIPTVIIFLMVAPFVLFTPLTALLGAWDDASFKSFRKAAVMAGPGKILVKPMLRVLEKIIPHCRLHDRFGIDDDAATREARELMAIKSAAVRPRDA